MSAFMFARNRFFHWPTALSMTFRDMLSHVSMRRYFKSLATQLVSRNIAIPSNAGGVGKKRDSERISLHTLHTGLQCCKPHEWKIKPRRTASSRALTAASVAVVRTRRRRSVCDGLDIICRRRRSNPPDTTPLVITPFSAAVGHRRTEPGGYFCWKSKLVQACWNYSLPKLARFLGHSVVWESVNTYCATLLCARTK